MAPHAGREVIDTFAHQWKLGDSRKLFIKFLDSACSRRRIVGSNVFGD